VERFNNCVEEIHNFIQHLVGGILLNFVLLVAIGITLFTMNVRLAFWTLIPAPLVIGSAFVFWRHLQPRYSGYWDSRNRLENVVYAAMTGVRVVKAYNQEEQERARFDAAIHRLRRARIHAEGSATVFYPIVGFIFSLGGLIVWYAGGKA